MWPETINYIQTIEAGAVFPKGHMALAAEGKTPKGWEVVRPMTAEERQALIEGPHEPHHLQPLCFF